MPLLQKLAHITTRDVTLRCFLEYLQNVIANFLLFVNQMAHVTFELFFVFDVLVEYQVVVAIVFHRFFFEGLAVALQVHLGFLSIHHTFVIHSIAQLNALGSLDEGGREPMHWLELNKTEPT